MGTWDAGLLDNDTALDGLADLSGTILTQVVEFGASPGRLATERVAAGVGLLLQLDAYKFSPDSPDTAQAIQQAVRAHLERMTGWPNHPKRVLQQVADGQGHKLAQRPAAISKTLARCLHAKSHPGAGFGRREPWLFVQPGSAAYVQAVARLCVKSIDEDFEDEGNWSDLCREGIGLCTLAALLLIDPCRIPRAKVERWRRLARKGLAMLEAAPDKELEFHQRFYANLDRVFGLALHKAR